MHKPPTTAPQEATMFTFASFDEAAAADAREYTESPSEREERLSVQAGQPLLSDSALTERDDEVAEDMASWEAEYRNAPGVARPPWLY